MGGRDVAEPLGGAVADILEIGVGQRAELSNDAWCRKRLTTSSGRSIGESRRITALTRLKMAVLAPMPSASERMANAVNAGRLARDRRPSRMSRWSPDSQPNRRGRHAPRPCALRHRRTRRARRCASHGSTPASRTKRSVSMSRWKRNSSSIRCSTSLRNSSRRRARAAHTNRITTHRITCSATTAPRPSAKRCQLSISSPSARRPDGVSQ